LTFNNPFVLWVYEMDITRSHGATTPMPRMHATIMKSATRIKVKSDNTNTVLPHFYTTGLRITDANDKGKVFLFFAFNFMFFMW
jgi:hypothetical protein